MPTITQRPATPAVINDSLPVPTSFPEIPADVTKRFPSMVAYKDQVDTWWKKTKVALTDMNQDAATTIQKIQGVMETQKASSGGFTAAINTERTARITADGALASLITMVTADYLAADTALSASITSETTARVTADSALATTITTLTSTVTTNNSTLTASISSEATTRASADSALSSRIDALVATAGSHVFVQTSSPTALGTNDLWWDSDDGFRRYYWDGSAWIDATDAQITTTAAAVTTESTARISGDTVLASTITTQIAIVNGNIASAVSTEASARATSDGFLEGKYTLTVAAGNVVTGMNITSSTGTGTNISSVIFQTDRFLIYSGSTGVQMFDATSGSVRLGGTLIVDTAHNKVYIGTGTYANTNTVFYVDSAGQFSLKDKLTWDGSNLSISGSITVTGGNAATTSALSSGLAGKIDTGSAAADINANTTTISGGKITTNTVTLTQLNFTPVETSNVIASINASSEGIVISGSRIQINGSTTFSTGYDPTGKISAGGAAADVNANATTIDGGMITTGTLNADRISGGTINATVSISSSGQLSAGSGYNLFQVTDTQLVYGNFTFQSYGGANGTAFDGVSGTAGFELRAYSDISGDFAELLVSDAGSGVIISSNGRVQASDGLGGIDIKHGKISVSDSFNKITPDDWTPILNTAFHAISFKYDGQFKVLVDATEFIIF